MANSDRMSRVRKTSAQWMGMQSAHNVVSMVKGMKKTTMPRVNVYPHMSYKDMTLMGGDLIPKPKGFGPADIGLVPSKKRKY